ncbi:GNAT family N-acetyltransferase [Streptomyces gelaticus]|uniref:GNAT family N-acetyltransferase n=1 Tax=Streptomyces gelaticus TaxID=285446 RepID=UPI00379FD0A3
MSRYKAGQFVFLVAEHTPTGRIVGVSSSIPPLSVLAGMERDGADPTVLGATAMAYVKIRALAVADDCRRQGIASALLARALTVHREHSAVLRVRAVHRRGRRSGPVLPAPGVHHPRPGRAGLPRRRLQAHRRRCLTAPRRADVLTHALTPYPAAPETGPPGQAGPGRARTSREAQRRRAAGRLRGGEPGTTSKIPCRIVPAHRVRPRPLDEGGQVKRPDGCRCVGKGGDTGQSGRRAAASAVRHVPRDGGPPAARPSPRVRSAAGSLRTSRPAPP